MQPSSFSKKLADAKRIGEEELQALDRAVKQAQSAATKSGGLSHRISGGGQEEGAGDGEVTSRLRLPASNGGGGADAGSGAAIAGAAAVTARRMDTGAAAHPPVASTGRATGPSFPATGLRLPTTGTPAAAAASADETHPSPTVGTPWTVNNAALPAYPPLFTPQLPFKAAGHSSDSSSGSSVTDGSVDRYRLRSGGGAPHVQPGGRAATAGAEAASATHDGMHVAAAGSHVEQAMSPTGALAVALGPSQEGPLALYPDYALVDPHSKWQRIKSWAEMDSKGAATAGTGVTGMHAAYAPPSIAPAQDDERSLDSTLLDLEVERVRVSMQASELARAAMAAATQQGPARKARPAVATASAVTMPSKQPGTAPRDVSAPGTLDTNAVVAMVAPVTAAPVPAMPAAVAGARQSLDAVLSLLAAQEPTASTAVITASPSKAAAAAGNATSKAPGFSFQSEDPSGKPQAVPAHGLVASQAKFTDGQHRNTDIIRETLAAPQLTPLPAKPASAAQTAAADPRPRASPFTAADVVERSTLEARAKGAQDELAAAEKRHAAEMERSGVRVAALEAALTSERALAGRLQGQVTAEIARAKALAEAEERARSGEREARADAEAARKALDSERRRSTEAAKAAAAALAEEQARVKVLDGEVKEASRKLADERDAKSRLQRQLSAAQKAANDAKADLARVEVARGEQERRLEAAAAQVAAMRAELLALNGRLAARDEQLLKHVQEVEQQQVAVLRDELWACQAQLSTREASYAALRQCVLAVSQSLAPSALAAAFSHKPRPLARFTASPAQHAALTERLVLAAAGGGVGVGGGALSSAGGAGDGGAVSVEDVAAVATRVKELLGAAAEVSLHAERAEVALASEAEAVADELRGQLSRAQARITDMQKAHEAKTATLSVALRTATARVEELMGELSEARGAAAAAQAASAQAAASADGRTRARMDAVLAQLAEAQADAATWQRKAEAVGTEAAARLTQLQDAEREMVSLKALAQAKDDRIQELRGAAAAAIASAGDADAERARRGTELGHVHAELEGVRAELAAARAGAAEAAHQLEASHVALASLEEALSHAESARAAAQDQVDELQAQVLAACQAIVQALMGGGGGIGGGITSQWPTDSWGSGPLAQLATALAAALPGSNGSTMLAPVTAAGLAPLAAAAVTEHVHSLRTEVDGAVRVAALIQRHLARTHGQLAAVAVVAAEQQQQQQQQEEAGASPSSSVGSASGSAVGGKRARDVGTDTEAHSGAAASGTKPGAHLSTRAATAPAPTSTPSSRAAAGLTRSGGALSLNPPGPGHLNQLLAELQSVSEILLSDAASAAAAVRMASAGRTALEAALAAAQSGAERSTAAAHKELFTLKSQVAAAMQVAARERAELEAKAEATAKELSQQLADATARAVAAEASLSDAQHQLDVLGTGADSARQQGLSLASQLSDARMQAAAAVAERDALVLQLQGLQRSAAALQAHAGRCAHSSQLDRVRLRVARGRRTLALREVYTRRREVTQLRASLVSLESRAAAGATRLAAATAEAQAATALVTELEARAQRADALVQKLEDRRMSLESDKRALADKAAAAAAAAVEAERQLELAKRQEAAARKEAERGLRAASAAAAAETRAATLLEALEGAEKALRESQANATRLLQEVAVLKDSESRALESVQQLEGQLVAERARIRELLVQHEQQAASAAVSAVAAAPGSPVASVRSAATYRAPLPHAAATAMSTTPAMGAGGSSVALLSQLGALQTTNAELVAAKAAADAEVQMLKRQLRRAQVTAQQHTPAEPGHVSAHAGASGYHPFHAAAPSLYTAASSVMDDAASVCSGAMSSRVPMHGMQLMVPLAHMGSGGGAVQISAQALSAKESRISELRRALAACLSERDALASQLEEARGPYGHLPSSVQTQMQQEATELRTAALHAQRKLFECQQQLARAQSGQAAAERGVAELQLAMRAARSEAELALQGLSSEQQQVAATVRTLTAALAAYQQQDVLARLTASEDARAALAEAQHAQRAAEDRCSALEGELGAARSRLGLLQAEAGRLTEQLAAAQDEVQVHKQQVTEAQGAAWEELQATRDAAQIAAERAEVFEGEAREVGELLAARDARCSALEEESRALGERCAALERQLHDVLTARRDARRTTGSGESGTSSGGAPDGGHGVPGAAGEVAVSNGMPDAPSDIRQVQQDLEDQNMHLTEQLALTHAAVAEAESKALALESRSQDAERRAGTSAGMLAEAQKQWHATAAASADELGALRARTLELELAVGEARSDAQGAAEARAAAQMALLSAEQEADAAHARAAALQARVDQQAVTLSELEEELAASHLTVQELRTQLSDALDRSDHGMHGSTDGVAAASMHVLALQEDIKHLRQQLEEEAAACAAADMAATAAEARAAAVTSQLLDLQEQLAQAEVQLAAVEAAHAAEQGAAARALDRVAEAQEEAGRWRQAAEGLGQERDVLSCEVQTLREELHAAKAGAERHGSAHSTAATAARVRQLEQEASEARAVADAWSRERAALHMQLVQAQQTAAAAASARAGAEAALAHERATHTQHRREAVSAMQASLREAEASSGDAAAATSLVAALEEIVRQQAGREQEYVAQVAGLRQELDACGQALQVERFRCIQLDADVQGLREQLAATAAADEAESVAWDARTVGASTPGSVSGSARKEGHGGTAQQLVILHQENRALIARLESMHGKLKIMRARLAQAEAELYSQAYSLSSVLHDALQSAAQAPSYKLTEGQSTPDTMAMLSAQLGAYKVALAAAQEEAAVASAQAAEAQSHADALAQRSQQDQQQRKARLASGLDAGEIARLKDQLHKQLGPGSQSAYDDLDVQALVDKVKAQRSEIVSLQEALNVSNSRRTQEVETSARISSELAQSERQVRDLQLTVSSLEQQLWQLQEQQERRRAEQLRSQDATSMGGHEVASHMTSGTQHRMYSPDSTGTAGCQELDELVSVWRDTCSVQQQRIIELEASASALALELEAAEERLVVAEVQVSQHTARIRDLEEALSAQHQVSNQTHEQAAAELTAKQQQVRTLEAQVRSSAAEVARKAEALQKLESQVAGLQAQLAAANARASSSERAAAEVGRQAEQQAGAMEELCARLTEATAVRQQHHHAALELRRLTSALRTLLLGSGSTQHDNSESIDDTTADAVSTSGREAAGSNGSFSAGPGSGSMVDTQELLDRLASELAQRGSAAAAAGSKARHNEASLRQKEEELIAMEGRLKAANERASALSAQLATRGEEVASLQAKLKRKECDVAAIEGEIQRQMADYERLKARLLQQERDGSRLVAGQDSLARKVDELHAALAAKQEDCAAAVVRSAQLQEQLTAASGALAAAQERLRGLEAGREAAERRAEAAVGQVHALQMELGAAQRGAAGLKEQVDKKGAEIRELHQMLKAWEAMRLGKDAQIAALMERCKRHEEDAAEKARTVEALRRKVSSVGRASSAHHTLNTGASGATGTGLQHSSRGAGGIPTQQHMASSSRPQASGASTGSSYAAVSQEAVSNQQQQQQRKPQVHVHGAGGAGPAASASSSSGSR